MRQETVEGYYVRPDFAYHTPAATSRSSSTDPSTTPQHQADKDERARAKLEDEAGWLVLRFHHEDDRTAACGQHPTGRPSSRRTPTSSAPARPPHDTQRNSGPAPWSPPAAGTGWSCPAPHRARCWSAHSAAATTKPPCCCPIWTTPQPRVFDAPSVDDRGDAARARLLRDALRLSFRATAGPFRSFAQLAVSPATTSSCR